MLSKQRSLKSYFSSKPVENNVEEVAPSIDSLHRPKKKARLELDVPDIDLNFTTAAPRLELDVPDDDLNCTTATSRLELDVPDNDLNLSTMTSASSTMSNHSKFLPKWLREFPWLIFNKQVRRAFCKACQE